MFGNSVFSRNRGPQGPHLSDWSGSGFSLHSQRLDLQVQTGDLRCHMTYSQFVQASIRPDHVQETNVRVWVKISSVSYVTLKHVDVYVPDMFRSPGDSPASDWFSGISAASLFSDDIRNDEILRKWSLWVNVFSYFHREPAGLNWWMWCRRKPRGPGGHSRVFEGLPGSAGGVLEILERDCCGFRSCFKCFSQFSYETF